MPPAWRRIGRQSVLFADSSGSFGESSVSASAIGPIFFAAARSAFLRAFSARFSRFFCSRSRFSKLGFGLPKVGVGWSLLRNRKGRASPITGLAKRSEL